MQLQLASAHQHKIADLLWAASTMEDVNKIVSVFGHDGRVVYELMVAAAFDEVDNTHAADMAIKNIIDKI